MAKELPEAIYSERRYSRTNEPRKLRHQCAIRVGDDHRRMNFTPPRRSYEGICSNVQSRNLRTAKYVPKSVPIT
jgi:hypothetical protein